MWDNITHKLLDHVNFSKYHFTDTHIYYIYIRKSNNLSCYLQFTHSCIIRFFTCSQNARPLYSLKKTNVTKGITEYMSSRYTQSPVIFNFVSFSPSELINFVTTGPSGYFERAFFFPPRRNPLAPVKKLCIAWAETAPRDFLLAR